MRAYGTRWVVAVLALAALLFGGVVYYLLHNQATMRHDAESEFAHRAAITARMTSATLAASVVSSPADMTSDFGGRPTTIEQALKAHVGPNDVLAAVLSVDGTVLGVWPRSNRTLAAAYYDSPDVQAAIRDGGALSDVVMWGNPTEPMLRISNAFNTPTGVRIFVHMGSAYVMSLASAYLADAPSVAGARGYLIDGRGRVLASTGTTLQGDPLPERGTARGESAAGRPGDLGDSYFAVGPVGGGTRWRVVLTAKRSRAARRRGSRAAARRGCCSAPSCSRPSR